MNAREAIDSAIAQSDNLAWSQLSWITEDSVPFLVSVWIPWTQGPMETIELCRLVASLCDGSYAGWVNANATEVDADSADEIKIVRALFAFEHSQDAHQFISQIEPRLGKDLKVKFDGPAHGPQWG